MTYQNSNVLESKGIRILTYKNFRHTEIPNILEFECTDISDTLELPMYQNLDVLELLTSESVIYWNFQHWNF